METKNYSTVIAKFKGIEYEYNEDCDATKWVDFGTQYKNVLDIPLRDIAISALHEFESHVHVQVVNIKETYDADDNLISKNTSMNLDTILHT